MIYNKPYYMIYGMWCVICNMWFVIYCWCYLAYDIWHMKDDQTYMIWYALIWYELIWFDVIWYVICDIQHIQITCQDSFPAHPLAFSDGILEFSEAPGREVASSWEKFGFGAWKWWENHGKLPWIHWLKIYFYLWEWSKHGHRLLVKSWFSDPSRFKKETAIECLQHMVNFTPAPQSSKVVFKICCPGPSKKLQLFPLPIHPASSIHERGA